MKNLKLIAVIIFSFLFVYGSFCQNARLSNQSLYCMNHFAIQPKIISDSNLHELKKPESIEYQMIAYPEMDALKVSSSKSTGPIEVKIYNDERMLIDRQKIKDQEYIDVSRLGGGMYIVQLICKHGKQSKLIFKT